MIALSTLLSTRSLKPDTVNNAQAVPMFVQAMGIQSSCPKWMVTRLAAAGDDKITPHANDGLGFAFGGS